MLRAASLVYPPIASQSISRDVPSPRVKVFWFHDLLRGSMQIVFHCAHRTSTFLSCAFCEQEKRSACSVESFWNHVARAQKIIRPSPLIPLPGCRVKTCFL